MTWDALIVGAGHNGLVAAARLAQSGRRVLVLEARDEVGGLLAGVSPVAHLPSGLNPAVVKGLGLARHGLAFGDEVATVSLGGTEPVRIRGGVATGTDAAISGAYAELFARLSRQAAALAPLMSKTPPRLRDGSLGELMTLAGLGLKIRRLGKADMQDLLRIALSNIWDLLEDEIGDGPLAGALAMDATLGGAMGPRSPGTVLPLLYRLAGAPRRRIVGGTPALVSSLLRAVESAGGQVRTGAGVAGLLVGDDRVEGVRLSSGEELRAPLVLSNLHPRRTLIDLLGAAHLDAEDTRRARLMASEGMVARLDFTLSDAPGIDGLAVGDLGERLVVAPSMGVLETAFNAAKYRELPAAPALECHYDAATKRLSVSAQFVLCHLKGGWTSTARDELERAVMSVLDAALPGTARLITGVTTMTPADIETQFGLPGGHWHHGEFRVDQMLMLRPFGGGAQYRMPVGGLYLCSAGAHPGGDITGLPGWNAAGQAMKDMRAGR